MTDPSGSPAPDSAANAGARAFAEHLLRHHPEWAAHLAAYDRSDPRDPAEPGSFRLELPAPGGVLVVLGQSTEALVTLPGGHERLFVWPAPEREQAWAEVLACVEWAMRPAGG